ncbi:hypothetical protein [Flammeovirga sp. SubArs3]|uniref:HYC_CC_PP family protein n=1 Tax=Flammeovirga sp. SubArs3 TaxID=2995316 RepID=UPI00248C1E31|nr:hypothetical protein [Flammeovirga sp. SubArs3]
MSKAIKNIFLSIVLIVGTIGIIANAHICQGMLKAVNMQASHYCCEMSMDMKEKSDCCENNAQHLKVESHFDHLIDLVEVPSFTYKELIKDLWASAYPTILPENHNHICTTQMIDLFIEKTPPIFRQTPINITNQTFIV